MRKTGSNARTLRQITASRRNRLRRLAKHAKGNGRLQKAARRMFEMTGEDTCSTSDLVEWCLWPPDQRRWNARNVAARRALMSIGAVEVGRARTTGRPIVWAITIYAT
jgi:hypothetical protein